MKKIIAIGGGEIGRPGYKIETKAIDQEIIKLSAKKNPRFLFIPTASGESEAYCDTVKNYFGKKLSCQVDVLYLNKNKLTSKQLQAKILQTDIIYVGGGDTAMMMRLWRKHGLDKILLKAYRKGIVLSGLSAGSICWFASGQSDYKKMKDPKAAYARVSGLGLIKALHVPHFDVDKQRHKDLKVTLKKTNNLAIALDNCCALEVLDDQYRVIASKKSAQAYKIYWKNNKYYQVLLSQDKTFRPLKELLAKI